VVLRRPAHGQFVPSFTGDSTSSSATALRHRALLLTPPSRGRDRVPIRVDTSTPDGSNQAAALALYILAQPADALARVPSKLGHLYRGQRTAYLY
jgi:hypothetical protein